MWQLETNRLILRGFKTSDLNDFYEYASVDGVGEAAGWPHHTDIEISKNILMDFIIKADVFAIVYKENNKVIGSLGVHHREEANFKGKIQKEIGYVLSKDYWGQGLMSEAVAKVIWYCFTELNVDILWCGHFNENTKSKRVVEKAGFIFYKEYVYQAKLLNKEFSAKKYILTKADYFKQNITEAISLLGKNLEVKIDRPLNSRHPKYNELIYLVNYGYIPNTLSPDGEELDAYVLGIEEPIDYYRGKCIAVIKRKNDLEDKLVIAPVDKRYTKRQVKKAIYFMEKYFKSKIIMKKW